jgi:hypothetical protein
MRTLAVLSEALAMVGGEEHDRALHLVAGVERIQEAGELAIDEGDLAIVWSLPVPLCEVRRWLVGGVRIVVMDPEEPARRWRRGVGRGQPP